MKVLLATFWYLPQVGGVSSYIYQLKRGLEEQGHEVDIFAQGTGPLFHIVNKNLTLEHARIAPLVSPSLNPISHVDAWMKKYETDRYCYELAALHFGLAQYDLIHTHDIISTRALSRVKPRHTPLIATIHGCLTKEFGIDRDDPMTWDYFATLEHYGVTSSDATIAPTQWLKNLYTRDFLVPPDRMTIIPYGMDVQAFRQRANEPVHVPLPEDKTIIVCPARLNHVKGHYTLLDALAQLKKRRTDWVCLLLGDGPLRRQLEQNCHLFNLQDHVMFMGDREDVPAILERADIFVLASLLDNHPFAVMEAQVSGKAVVVSDAGGIPEMVSHGKTGLTSPAGQPGPLATNLEHVIANRSLRETLASNAQQSGVRDWSHQTMLKRIFAVYERALRNKQKGRTILPPTDGGNRRPPQTNAPDVWRNIQASLPLGYQIPDPVFIRAINSKW